MARCPPSTALPGPDPYSLTSNLACVTLMKRLMEGFADTAGPWAARTLLPTHYTDYVDMNAWSHDPGFPDGPAFDRPYQVPE